MNSVQLLNFERTSCDALEVFFFSNKGKIKSIIFLDGRQLNMQYSCQLLLLRTGTLYFISRMKYLFGICKNWFISGNLTKTDSHEIFRALCLDQVENMLAQPAQVPAMSWMYREAL